MAQFSNAAGMISARHKEITHDLNNYADVIHHSPAIDLQVLFHLATGLPRQPRDADRAARTAQGTSRGLPDQ